MIIYIILIAVFLTCSAFFSGMEAAIFSISRFRTKTLVFENKKGANHLARIKKEPGKTLASLLLSNDLVNIGASSVAAIILTHIVLVYKLSNIWSFVMEAIIMTSILLIFGEITPKVIAISNAEFFALKFSLVIDIISRIFNPVARLPENFTKFISSGKKMISVSERDIKFMLQEAKHLKILDESEEQIGHQILKFGKTLVREIAVSKKNVIGINVDVNILMAKQLIKETKHSRLCVYNDEGDVQGVLYAKDIFLRGSEIEDKSVSVLMRKPYFVSDAKPIDELLAEFRKKGIHFGVVVNEQGKFVGIVTLADVLESLFGEIIGEND